MDTHRFDTITRRFAARRSRRQAMVQAGTGLAAGALAAAGLAHSARAQDATPAATATADGDKTMFLFLQAFQSGTVAPKEGAEGRYTLTLAQGLGQTVYFSDRPERLVGASPTPQFLAGLGFPPDNPPNAALVVETGAGQTEIAVVELYSPAYDEATDTATYEVAVLAEWEDALGVGFTQAPADLAAFGETFGAAHLFIDDCPDGTVSCSGDGGVIVEIFDAGFCWNWGKACCQPCNGGDDWQTWWTQACYSKYPEDCERFNCTARAYEDLVCS